MKHILLLILTTVVASYAQSQERNAIVLAVDGVYTHSSEMFGPGYKLTYQKHLWKSIGIEIGGSYSIAVYTDSQGEVVNDVLMLDMTKHHAAYHFGINGLLNVLRTDKVLFSLIAGPLVSYQSNLYDKNHYTILNPSVVSNYPDIYEQEVNEGIFLGADMALQLAFRLNPSWGLVLDARYKAVIDAESLNSFGLGLTYVW